MERARLARGDEDDYETGYGGAAVAEALDVRAGDRYIDTTRTAPDLLSGHGGTGENLYLGWTAVPDTATAIDVVVHLHGYSAGAPARSLLEHKVATSGLDLSGRTRPTLAILPRGRKITDEEIRAAARAGKAANPNRYTFPALLAQEGRGLEALIHYALTFVSRDILGGRTLPQGRLILTAHSGGGAPLNDLLAHHARRAACDPHEVQIFDALYGPVAGIADWVRSRVTRDTALAGGEAALARDGGGCRVLYGAGTQAGSLELARAFPSAVLLGSAYRAERTGVEHGDIPRVFGRALLTSIRADLVLVPSRAHAAVAPFGHDDSTALAADDDARSWPAADEAARTSRASRVRGWVLATDRSAIELLGDAERRRHFLEQVNWPHQDFQGRGPRSAESEALFNELQRVVPERRVPGGLRYHNVDPVVAAVPGNGGARLFPEAKDAFVRMREAARADGVSLTILAAWRSAATQDRIKSGNPNPAAVARRVSSHTYGLAIDLALTFPGLTVTEISTASMPNLIAMYRSPVYKWMALNGRRFGWFPYRREPWHWEYNPEGFKARYESGPVAESLDAPKGKLEKEFSIASYRRLISTSTVGKVYARFEGKAKFSVETTAPSKVEVTLGKDAEVQINDLVFGAKGSFKVAGDKVEFGLGTDDFSMTFDPFSLNPLSIHLPVVQHTLALEKDLPKLKLKGSVTLELEFTIDFCPNYARLAKVVNKQNLKALLQATKSKLYSLGGKVATKARLVIKAGRSALVAPLTMIGNKIGRKLAWNSIKLGSQAAALRKLAGSLGKLAGVAGILIETRMLVKAAIPGVLAKVNKETLEAIIPTFANSYGEFLALMTDDKAPLDDQFFEWDMKIKRITVSPPDLYKVVEHLSQTGKVIDPDQNAGKWVTDQIKRGIAFKEETISLADIDWRVLFREAYNLYFLFMDAANHASDKTRNDEAWKAIRGAHKLVQDAGRIAAYQDVFTFATTSSLYQDSAGKPPQDVWEEWKNVRTFHQTVFGNTLAARQAYYVSLIDHSTLTCQIPPFADYD